MHVSLVLDLTLSSATSWLFDRMYIFRYSGTELILYLRSLQGMALFILCFFFFGLLTNFFLCTSTDVPSIMITQGFQELQEKKKEENLKSFTSEERGKRKLKVKSYLY